MIEELKKLKEVTRLCIETHTFRVDEGRRWMSEFHAIKDLIFITDTNYTINFVNEDLRKKLDIKSDCDIIGTYYYETIYNQGDCDSIKGEMSYIKRLKGWYRRTTVPIYDNGREVIGYIHTLHDATSILRNGCWDNRI